MLVLQVYESIIGLGHDIFNMIKVQSRLNFCFINTSDVDLKLSGSKLHFLIIKINKETDPFAKKPKWSQAGSIQRKLRGTPIAMETLFFILFYFFW